jgi:hypothetical protein
MAAYHQVSFMTPDLMAGFSAGLFDRPPYMYVAQTPWGTWGKNNFM